MQKTDDSAEHNGQRPGGTLGYNRGADYSAPVVARRPNVAGVDSRPAFMNYQTHTPAYAENGALRKSVTENALP